MSTALTLLSESGCKFAYMHIALEMMADRIKRARAEAKLTQEQVAAAVGVTAAAVAQWETGNSKSLRPANLFKLARIVKKSPEWIATGEGPEELMEDLDNVVAELPIDDRQQSLDFIEYRIEKAATLLGEQRTAHYMSMIARIRADMAKRSRRQQ